MYLKSTVHFHFFLEAKMHGLLLLFVTLVSCSVSSGIILPVPGYGTLNGTEETAIYTSRLFYAFRSVYYAEKPSPEVRFLVRLLFNYKSQNKLD